MLEASCAKVSNRNPVQDVSDEDDDDVDDEEVDDDEEDDDEEDGLPLPSTVRLLLPLLRPSRANSECMHRNSCSKKMAAAGSVGDASASTNSWQIEASTACPSSRSLAAMSVPELLLLLLLLLLRPTPSASTLPSLLPRQHPARRRIDAANEEAAKTACRVISLDTRRIACICLSAFSPEPGLGSGSAAPEALIASGLCIGSASFAPVILVPPMASKRRPYVLLIVAPGWSPASILLLSGLRDALSMGSANVIALEVEPTPVSSSFAIDRTSAGDTSACSAVKTARKLTLILVPALMSAVGRPRRRARPDS